MGGNWTDRDLLVKTPTIAPMDVNNGNSPFNWPCAISINKVRQSLAVRPHACTLLVGQCAKAVGSLAPYSDNVRGATYHSRKRTAAPFVNNVIVSGTLSRI
jgi:hypothetical protein